MFIYLTDVGFPKCYLIIMSYSKFIVYFQPCILHILWLLFLLVNFPFVSPACLTVISRNAPLKSHLLPMTGCAGEFLNNALWDTFHHALHRLTSVQSTRPRRYIITHRTNSTSHFFLRCWGNRSIYDVSIVSTKANWNKKIKQTEAKQKDILFSQFHRNSVNCTLAWAGIFELSDRGLLHLVKALRLRLRNKGVPILSSST